MVSDGSATRPGELSFKIIILGDVNVGKTSLLMRYINGTFSDVYDENFDGKVKTISYHGVSTRLVFWDTQGQERVRRITSTYFRGAHAAIMVCDVSEPGTLAGLKTWHQDVRHTQIKTKAVVANKTDLVSADSGSAPGTVTEAARAFAHENELSFWETSAKTGKGVGELFQGVIDDVLKREVVLRKDGSFSQRDDTPDDVTTCQCSIL